MKKLSLKKLSLLLISASSLLLLSSCVDRAQADKKLERGCAAGIALYVPENFSIKETKGATFSDAKAGEGDRRVALTVVQSDGWYDEEKTYYCNFAESFGFMKMSHRAEIYQIDLGDGRVFGKQDGNIVGGFAEWQKITGAVDKALGH